jgi:lipopolysaccharide export system permease protein
MAGILAELLFQFTLTFVPMALPLAILTGLADDIWQYGGTPRTYCNEVIRHTASEDYGSPYCVDLFLSVASFFFSNNVLPYSNRKSITLLWDIRNKRPELKYPDRFFLQWC